jgi:hypothetical protein
LEKNINKVLHIFYYLKFSVINSIKFFPIKTNISSIGMGSCGSCNCGKRPEESQLEIAAGQNQKGQTSEEHSSNDVTKVDLKRD